MNIILGTFFNRSPGCHSHRFWEDFGRHLGVILGTGSAYLDLVIFATPLRSWLNFQRFEGLRFDVFLLTFLVIGSGCHFVTIFADLGVHLGPQRTSYGASWGSFFGQKGASVLSRPWS